MKYIFISIFFVDPEIEKKIGTKLLDMIETTNTPLLKKFRYDKCKNWSRFEQL